MRRDGQRLRDILDAANAVLAMVGNKSEAEFVDDEVLRSAVAHKLTIVGEAAARMGASTRALHPGVPWPDIVGFRNILVHDYFGIYWPLVFRTVTERVPELICEIEKILASEFPD
jgi:uncharacterized protein with HEPN domain